LAKGHVAVIPHRLERIRKNWQRGVVAIANERKIMI